MNQIKCPHCGTSFTVNETEYSQLLSQVRGAEFDKELHDRLEKETALLRTEAEKQLQAERADREQEVLSLRNQLETSLLEQKRQFQEEKLSLEKSEAQHLAEKEAEISRLQATLERETLLLQEQAKTDLATRLADKDREIEELRHQLASLSQQQELALQSALAVKEEEIVQLKIQSQENQNQQTLALAELTAQLERQKLEQTSQHQLALSQLERERDDAKSALILQEQQQELLLAATKQDYENQLKAVNEQVDFYKNFKAQQSTKAIGESLERYAESEFNKVRHLAFPNAYFEKDNTISESGSKGDYIYRETDGSGVEILSIMFEMKNEADTTAKKHKNEEFFKELDKDRREKNCEYAVLVSMLEADNDYYNTGIVDVSHKYPKMYVVRPQFFIQLIGLLRNAALNSLAYKQELALIREQHIDITHFEEDLEEFKQKFAKNYTSASTNFKKAIDEIDKSIKRMEEVKRFLTTSENQLRLANNKLEDVSVKKLTRKNPTMKAKFDALKSEEENNS